MKETDDNLPALRRAREKSDKHAGPDAPERQRKLSEREIREIEAAADSKFARPFPTLRLLQFRLASFAARLTVGDVVDAMGLIDKGKVEFAFRQYFEHLKCMTNSATVDPKFRVSQMSDGKPDEKLVMEPFEKRLGVPSQKPKDFRDGLLRKFGSWGQDPDHDGKVAIDHLNQIFPELFQEYQASLVKSLATYLIEFKRDLAQYFKDDSLPPEGSLDSFRQERYVDGVKGLLEKGYPKAGLVEVVTWALEECIRDGAQPIEFIPMMP
jgi:PrkA serine protein kinase C-terminal domain